MSNYVVLASSNTGLDKSRTLSPTSLNADISASAAMTNPLVEERSEFRTTVAVQNIGQTYGYPPEIPIGK